MGKEPLPKQKGGSPTPYRKKQVDEERGKFLFRKINEKEFARRWRISFQNEQIVLHGDFDRIIALDPDRIHVIVAEGKNGVLHINEMTVKGDHIHEKLHTISAAGRFMGTELSRGRDPFDTP